MKSRGSAFRAGGHEQRMTPPREDSYRAGAKLHDPTVCPECGASFRKGRWTWGPSPASRRAGNRGGADPAERAPSLDNIVGQ